VFITKGGGLLCYTGMIIFWYIMHLYYLRTDHDRIIHEAGEAEASGPGAKKNPRENLQSFCKTLL